MQIRADLREVYEAVVVEEGRNGKRVQFRMVFLFELEVGFANGGLMAPVAIIGKLSRVSFPAVVGPKRLNALLKLPRVDLGEKVVGLILALRVYVAQRSLDGSALHAYQNILLIIGFNNVIEVVIRYALNDRNSNHTR